MKKINTIIFLILMTFVFVMADDTVKVLRIYKDGDITTIPLAYIDSIDHSKYDIENVLWNEHKTSILWSVDSTYRLPLEEIDSMVIDHVSMQKLSTNMNLIKEHLSSLDGQPVDQFQNNLLSWLNNECNYVYKATLSPSKEHIVVEMREGMEIYLSFVNTDDLISDIDEDASYTRMKSDNKSKQKFYNISSIPGEEIINPKTLYIQGRSMPSKEKELDRSNADAEWQELQKIFSLSPLVNGKDNLKKISKSLSFLEEDFSKYGLIIFSQTHGDDGKSGDFEIEDELHWKWWRKSVVSSDEVDEEKQICVTPVITIYIGQGLCYFSDEPNLYWVSAKSLRSKFKNNPIYASYCFSGYLGNEATNATIYGYRSPAKYACGLTLSNTPAKDSLISRIDRFCNGYIYTDAMWFEPYSIWFLEHIPSINKQKSKQRYFSITSNEITKKTDNENPIITGTINGYKNLKSGLTPVVYVHEGEYAFEPDDRGVERVQGSFIKSDGTFSCEYNKELKAGTKYGFIIGFEYGGNVYYGEVKYFTKQGDNICPDEHHPHMIDLGLPSGTKWCCCNVGAKSPEEYGGYFAWGETTEKPSYDWDSYKWHMEYLGDEEFTKYNSYDKKTVLDDDDDAAMANMKEKIWCMPTVKQQVELIQNCYAQLTERNGVDGLLITGKNGSLLFLPAAGYYRCEKLDEVGRAGYYWSSSLWPYYDWHAYFMTFLSSGYWEIDYYDRFEGYSVRAVSK